MTGKVRSSLPTFVNGLPYAVPFRGGERVFNSVHDFGLGAPAIGQWHRITMERAEMPGMKRIGNQERLPFAGSVNLQVRGNLASLELLQESLASP